MSRAEEPRHPYPSRPPTHPCFSWSLTSSVTSCSVKLSSHSQLPLYFLTHPHSGHFSRIPAPVAPVCVAPPALRGVALNETVRLECEVASDPPPLGFRWLFVSSYRKETPLSLDRLVRPHFLPQGDSPQPGPVSAPSLVGSFSIV